MNDIANTTIETDPENEVLSVDGIVQPRDGMVFHNGDTITYRPNLGFIGTDTFYYWVTDGQGNYSKAGVEVYVSQ